MDPFGTDPDPRIPNTPFRIRILLFSGLEIRDIPNKGSGVVVGSTLHKLLPVFYFGTDPDPRIPNTAFRIRIMLFSGLQIRDIPNKGRGVMVGPLSQSYFQCCTVFWYGSGSADS
jgi:hypothetical protein